MGGGVENTLGAGEDVVDELGLPQPLDVLG
jgi:hypothetical protein